jgi:hypothetical protein
MAFGALIVLVRGTKTTWQILSFGFGILALWQNFHPATIGVIYVAAALIGRLDRSFEARKQATIVGRLAPSSV